jgi:ribosomal subunit interface protein
MQIQINPDNIKVSEYLANRIDEEVRKAVKHFTDRVTRVEVHVQDQNGPQKSGIDKRCVMEARLAGDEPVTVNAESDDMYEAVHQTAEKLERAVGRRFEKAKDHHAH